MGAGVSTDTDAQAQERTRSIIHAASAPRCLQHPARLCPHPMLDRVPTAACTPRRAVTTAKKRAHRQRLPGRAVPPHLPGHSARYSTLHGFPVTLRSLQAPGSHPCPFLPPSFPLHYGMGVASGGVRPGTGQGSGALSRWCRHPCHCSMPGPGWCGSTWVGEMHWVGKRSPYLFMISYLFFTSAGK